MNTNGIVVLGAAEVRRRLPMRVCIDVMEAAFGALAAGQAVQPVRQVVHLPGGRGALYAMPAWLGAQDAGGALAVKLITLFPGNAAHGLETHQGVIVLFGEQGEPRALIEASSVTAVRTAAVSALATRLLARPDAGDLAILGAGVQAKSHLEAMLAVRPVRRVRVWSRTAARARAFAQEMTAVSAVPVEAVPTAEAAVTDADLICTVTGSPTPVLLGRWLAEGAHINAVGASTPAARELDTEAVARAAVFVDSRDAALAEAGDLLIPCTEGAFPSPPIRAELAELVSGRHPGRESESQITLFKSLGLAVEDVACARFLASRAADGPALSLE